MEKNMTDVDENTCTAVKMLFDGNKHEKAGLLNDTI